MRFAVFVCESARTLPIRYADAFASPAPDTLNMVTAPVDTPNIIPASPAPLDTCSRYRGEAVPTPIMLEVVNLACSALEMEKTRGPAPLLLMVAGEYVCGTMLRMNGLAGEVKCT